MHSPARSGKAAAAARNAFDPHYRESTKPRSGTRAGKTSGSRNAGSRLRLVFELSQFFAQARRFGAILCRLGMVLDGGDAAGRIEKLGDGVVFAFAGMLELAGKIILVLCVASQSGNAALKIVDFRPTLSPRDGRISYRSIGSFPQSRAAVYSTSSKAWRLSMPRRFP